MNKLMMALAAIAICGAAFSETQDVPLEPGKRTSGFFGGFNVDYIRTGQRGVTGMTRVVMTPPGYRLPPDFNNPVDFIQSARMRYRFRYGDDVPKTQMGTEDWKELPMMPRGTDLFVTNGELEIPDYPCDLEYYFDYTRRTPYYEYVDYSGQNIGVPGYTEEPAPMVTSRLERVSSDGLPSRGKDWYRRIRSGKSQILHVRIAE